MYKRPTVSKHTWRKGKWEMRTMVNYQRKQNSANSLATYMSQLTLHVFIYINN